MLNKKIKKINNTLYLVAASILLLICIIAVTGYDYNSVKKRTLERTEGVLAASSREQSTLFIEKIDSKYKILRAAAEAIVEHHSDKADKYETASRLLKEASFYSVGISDSKGNAVLSNGEKSNISDRKYFKDNMAGRSAIDRVDGTLVDRKNIFIISVPIIKKSIISGSLFGIYDENNFSSMLIQQAYKTNGYSFICSDKGEIIVSTHHKSSIWGKKSENDAGKNNLIELLSKVPSNESELKSLKNNFSLGHDGIIRYRLTDGINRIAFYHSLGINGWYIFSVVTTDIIESRIAEDLSQSRHIYTIIIITAVILMVIVILIEKRSIRQVKEDREKIKIREEEYRIASEHSGKSMLRYDIEKKRLVTTPKLVELYGLSTVYENFPYSIFESESIASESLPDVKKFYNEIMQGKPHGCVDAISLFFPKVGSFRWYTHEFTTIFNKDGKPTHAIITFSDITERIEKEKSYQKWRDYIYALGSNKAAFFCHDLTSDTVIEEDDWGNEYKMFSFEGTKLFNERTKEFAEKYVHPDDKPTYIEFLNKDRLIFEFHQGKINDSTDFRIDFGGRIYKWLRVSTQLIEDKSTSDIKAALFYQDIDEQKRKELSIIEKSQLDPLTKVLNREALIKKIEALLQRSSDLTRHAIIIIDIDKFKAVNDTLGHIAGDELLVELSNRLKSMMRSDDIVGRIGGDEFMVCLKDIPYDAVIDKRAKQIVKLLRKKVDGKIYISASIGVSIYPKDGTTASELYEKADIALYYTKASRKDNYTFYKEGMSIESNHLSLAKGKKAAKSQLQKKKILIADDSSLDRKILSHIFEKDMDVVEASDATEALRKMRAYGASLSLVILDYMMPDMSGFEVLDIIANDTELSQVPVIVVSSDDSADNIVSAVEHGAADFLTKPLDIKLITLKVNSAIMKRENDDLRLQNSYLQLQGREEQRYRKVLESTGTIVIEYDWGTCTTIYDPIISKILAGRYDERVIWDIFKSDSVAAEKDINAMEDMAADLAVNNSAETNEMNLKLCTVSGTMRWFRFRIVKINTDSAAPKMIITLNDINKEVMANERLRYLAEFDTLTGLHNKNYFGTKVRELVSRAAPNSYAIVVFDVDRFKMVNDLFGHEEGDTLLIHIANGLMSFKESTAPENTELCRLSADNFAICLSYTPEIIEEMVKYLKADISKYKINYEITLSTGVYIIDDPLLPIDIMLDRAHIAKRTVKGSYVLGCAYYDDKIRKSLLAEQEIISKMESALRNSEFEIYLQPQFDRSTNELIGAEALVRWASPTKGLIEPADFIPIFERTGFITNLDKYVLERTCAIIRKWLNKGINTVPIAVNISRTDIYDPNLCRNILSCVKKYELTPECIKLEITESAYNDSPQQIIEVTKDLQAHGFKVEMDDFGTGYSSLNMLKDIPVNVLKLDMDFLAIRNEESGPFILHSVIKMAKGLGMDVIAEGVETPEQADFMLKVDCRFQQGYFYSKPIPSDEFEKKYLNGSDSETI